MKSSKNYKYVKDWPDYATNKIYGWRTYRIGNPDGTNKSTSLEFFDAIDCYDVDPLGKRPMHPCRVRNIDLRIPEEECGVPNIPGIWWCSTVPFFNLQAGG